MHNKYFLIIANASNFRSLLSFTSLSMQNRFIVDDTQKCFHNFLGLEGFVKQSAGETQKLQKKFFILADVNELP